LAWRGLAAVLVGFVRFTWARPLSTLLAATVACVLVAGRVRGLILIDLLALCLLAVRYGPPTTWDVIARPWRWQSRRAAVARARRDGRRVAGALGLVDYGSGRPYHCSLWRDRQHGKVPVRVEVQAPLSDEELRRRLSEWAAVLALPANASLRLRRGHDASHRIVEVVSPPPPLPEKLELPISGDLANGLVLGVREDGELWRWSPYEVPHVLVTGATGSGKTRFARRVAASWLAAGANVVLLDYGKGLSFGVFADYPGARRAVSKADCESLLGDVNAGMQSRYEALQKDPAAQFVPLLVVFEEPFVAMEPSSGRSEEAREDQRLSLRLADHVVRIAMLGRECGVHLLMCPQRGDASALGSGAARDQLGLRVLLLRAAMDATVDMAIETSRSTLIPGREPPVAIRDLPSPPGRALVRGPNGYQLVQVAL